MRKILLIIAGLFGLALLTNLISPNMIVNGDFETGDFSSWTLIGNPQNNGVDTGFPHSGLYNAVFGEKDALGSLSQTIHTQVGAAYVLSFWFAPDSPNPEVNMPHRFSVSIDNHVLLDLTNPQGGDYHHYSYRFTAASKTTKLTFQFRDKTFFMKLDDVSVIPAATVIQLHSLYYVGTWLLDLIFNTSEIKENNR